MGIAFMSRHPTRFLLTVLTVAFLCLHTHDAVAAVTSTTAYVDSAARPVGIYILPTASGYSPGILPSVIYLFRSSSSISSSTVLNQRPVLSATATDIRQVTVVVVPSGNMTTELQSEAAVLSSSYTRVNLGNVYCHCPPTTTSYSDLLNGTTFDASTSLPATASVPGSTTQYPITVRAVLSSTGANSSIVDFGIFTASSGATATAAQPLYRLFLSGTTSTIVGYIMPTAPGDLGYTHTRQIYTAYVSSMVYSSSLLLQSYIVTSTSEYVNVGVGDVSGSATVGLTTSGDVPFEVGYTMGSNISVVYLTGTRIPTGSIVRTTGGATVANFPYSGVSLTPTRLYRVQDEATGSERYFSAVAPGDATYSDMRTIVNLAASSGVFINSTTLPAAIDSTAAEYSGEVWNCPMLGSASASLLSPLASSYSPLAATSSVASAGYGGYRNVSVWYAGSETFCLLFYPSSVPLRGASDAQNSPSPTLPDAATIPTGTQLNLAYVPTRAFDSTVVGNNTLFGLDVVDDQVRYSGGLLWAVPFKVIQQYDQGTITSIDSARTYASTYYPLESISIPNSVSDKANGRVENMPVIAPDGYDAHTRIRNTSLSVTGTPNVLNVANMTAAPTSRAAAYNNINLKWAFLPGGGRGGRDSMFVEATVPFVDGSITIGFGGNATDSDIAAAAYQLYPNVSSSSGTDSTYQSYVASSGTASSAGSAIGGLFVVGYRPLGTSLATTCVRQYYMSRTTGLSSLQEVTSANPINLRNFSLGATRTTMTIRFVRDITIDASIPIALGLNNASFSISRDTISKLFWVARRDSVQLSGSTGCSTDLSSSFITDSVSATGFAGGTVLYWNGTDLSPHLEEVSLAASTDTSLSRGVASWPSGFLGNLPDFTTTATTTSTATYSGVGSYTFSSILTVSWRVLFTTGTTAQPSDEIQFTIATPSGFTGWVAFGFGALCPALADMITVYRNPTTGEVVVDDRKGIGSTTVIPRDLNQSFTIVSSTDTEVVVRRRFNTEDTRVSAQPVARDTLYQRTFGFSYLSGFAEGHRVIFTGEIINGPTFSTTGFTQSATLYTFVNDTTGASIDSSFQRDVIDVAPGQIGYSDLFRVVTVRVPSNYTGAAVAFKSDIPASWSSDENTVTAIVRINCPVVHPSSDVSIDATYFPVPNATYGASIVASRLLWYRGNPLKCLEFPTAINAVANITNEVYLLRRYGSNTTVIDTVFAVSPTNTSYFSPFCRVFTATASIGYVSGTYKSKADILAAHLDVTDTGVFRNYPMIVNETSALPTVASDSTPTATIDALATGYAQSLVLHSDTTALEYVQLYWTYTDASASHVLRVMIVAYSINGYVSIGFSNSSYQQMAGSDIVMGFINSATAASCVRVLRGDLPTAAPSGTPTLQIRNQQVIQSGGAVALLFERDFDGGAQESARIPTTVQGGTSRVLFATYRGFVSSSCAFDDYSVLYHGDSPHGSLTLSWLGDNGVTTTTAPTSAPSQAFTSNDALVATTIALTPLYYRGQYRQMYCADMGTSSNLRYLASSVTNMALDGPAAKYNSQLPPAMLRLWNATSMTPWMRTLADNTTKVHPYIISDFPGGSPHYSGAWALYDVYLSNADASILYDATTIFAVADSGSDKRLAAIVNCPIVHPDTKLAGDGLNSTYPQIQRVSLTLSGQPVTCLDFGMLAPVSTRHEDAAKGGKFSYFDVDNLRVSPLYNFSVRESGSGSIALRPMIADDLATPFRRIVGINSAPVTGTTYSTVENIYSLPKLASQDSTSTTTRANTAYVGMVVNCFVLPLVTPSMQATGGSNVTVLSENEGSYNSAAVSARTISQSAAYFAGRAVSYIRISHPTSAIGRYASPTRYGGFGGYTPFYSGLIAAAQAGLADVQPQGVDPETGLPFVFVARQGNRLSDPEFQTEMVVDVAPGMYRYAEAYRIVVVDASARAPGSSLQSLSNVTNGSYPLTLTNLYLNCPAVSSGSTLASTPISVPLQTLHFRGQRMYCANFGTWSKANVLPRSIIKVLFNATIKYTSRTYSGEATRTGLFVSTPGSPAVGTNSNSTFVVSQYSYVIRGRLDQLHSSTTTFPSPLPMPYSNTTNPVLSSFPSPVYINLSLPTASIQFTVLSSMAWNTASNPSLFPQAFDPFNATLVYNESSDPTPLVGIPALYTFASGTTGLLTAVPGVGGYIPYFKEVAVQVSTSSSAIGTVSSMTQLLALNPTTYTETYTVYSCLVLQVGSSAVSVSTGTKGSLAVYTSGGFTTSQLLYAPSSSPLIVRNRNLLIRTSTESLAAAPIVFNMSKAFSGPLDTARTAASYLPPAPSTAVVYVFRRGSTVDSSTVANQPFVMASAPGASTYHGSLGTSGHFDAWKVAVVTVPANYTGAAITSDVPFQTPANLPSGWSLNTSTGTYLNLFAYVNTSTATMPRMYSPTAALLQTTLHEPGASPDDVTLMCPETTAYYSGTSVVSLNCGFSVLSTNVSEMVPTTSTQLNSSAVVTESGVGAEMFAVTVLEATNGALFDSSTAAAMQCWASGRSGVCYNFSSTFPVSWARSLRVRNASIAGSEGATARKYVFRNGPTLHVRHGLSSTTAATRGTSSNFDVVPPVVRLSSVVGLADSDVVELYVVNVFGVNTPATPFLDASSMLTAAETNGWPILYTGLVQTGHFTLTQSTLGSTLSGLEDSTTVYAEGSTYTHLIASTGDRTDLVTITGSAAIAVTAPNGTFSHYVLDDLPQSAFARRQPLRDLYTVVAATEDELSDSSLRTFEAASLKYASQLNTATGLGVIYVDTQDTKPSVGDPVERLYERRQGWYEGSIVYFYTFEDDNLNPTAATNSNLNASLSPSGRFITYPNVPSMMVAFRTLSSTLSVISTDVGTRLVDSLPGHDTYNDLHLLYYCDLYSGLPSPFTFPKSIQELQAIISKGYAAPLKSTGQVFLSPVVHMNSNVQLVDRYAAVTNEDGVKATSVMYEGRYYRVLDFGVVTSPLIEGSNRIFDLRRDDTDGTNLTTNTLFDSVAGNVGYTPMRQMYVATMTANYATNAITGVVGLESASPFLVSSIRAFNTSAGGSTGVAVFSAPIVTTTTAAAASLQDDYVISTSPTSTTDMCWAWGTVTAPSGANPFLNMDLPAVAEGGGSVNFVTGTTDESTASTITALAASKVSLGDTMTLAWAVQPIRYTEGLQDATYSASSKLRRFGSQAVDSGAGSYSLNELEIIFTLTCNVGGQWAAFGISASGGMGNSDILLAHVGLYVAPGAAVSTRDTTLLDMFSPPYSYTLPEVDPVQNVRIISSELLNSNGGFVITFARPLVPSEVTTGYDFAITNSLQNVIWAQGPMVFTSGSALSSTVRQHTSRGRGTINFLASESLRTPSVNNALDWSVPVLVAVILVVFVVAMLLRYVAPSFHVCYWRPVAWLLAKSNRRHEESLLAYWRACVVYDRERGRRERVRDLALLARNQPSGRANVAPTLVDENDELDIEEASPLRPPAAEAGPTAPQHVDMHDVPRPTQPRTPTLLGMVPFWLLNFTAAEWIVLALLYGLCAMWIVAQHIDLNDSRLSVPAIRAVGKGAQFMLYFVFMPLFRSNLLLQYVFRVSFHRMSHWVPLMAVPMFCFGWAYGLGMVITYNRINGYPSDPTGAQIVGAIVALAGLTIVTFLSLKVTFSSPAQRGDRSKASPAVSDRSTLPQRRLVPRRVHHYLFVLGALMLMVGAVMHDPFPSAVGLIPTFILMLFDGAMRAVDFCRRGRAVVRSYGEVGSGANKPVGSLKYTGNQPQAISIKPLMVSESRVLALEVKVPSQWHRCLGGPFLTHPGQFVMLRFHGLEVRNHPIYAEVSRYRLEMEADAKDDAERANEERGFFDYINDPSIEEGCGFDAVKVREVRSRRREEVEATRAANEAGRQQRRQQMVSEAGSGGDNESKGPVSDAVLENTSSFALTDNFASPFIVSSRAMQDAECEHATFTVHIKGQAPFGGKLTSQLMLLAERDPALKTEALDYVASKLKQEHAQYEDRRSHLHAARQHHINNSSKLSEVERRITALEYDHARRVAFWEDRQERVSEAYKTLLDLSISVEGPYGGTTLPLQSYETLIIVAGGVGMASGVSLLEALTQPDFLTSRTNVKTVVVMWVCRYKEDFAAFASEIHDVLTAQRRFDVFVYLHASSGRDCSPENALVAERARDALGMDEVSLEIEDAPNVHDASLFSAASNPPFGEEEEDEEMAAVPPHGSRLGRGAPREEDQSGVVTSPSRSGITAGMDHPLYKKVPIASGRPEWHTFFQQQYLSAAEDRGETRVAVHCNGPKDAFAREVLLVTSEINDVCCGFRFDVEVEEF